MIDRLISLSLEKRVLVLFGVVVLVALGVQSFIRLPIDAFPDVTNIQVEVLSNAPGLSPLEVEKFVTYPLETTMRGLPRLSGLRSVSKFGLSVITVVFEDGVDIYFARAARPRAPDRGQGEGPGRRRDRHGPRLDGHGGDLPIHARGTRPPGSPPTRSGGSPSGARSRTGCSPRCSSPSPASTRSTPSAAISASSRSSPTRTSSSSTTCRSPRSRRPSGRTTGTSAATSSRAIPSNTSCAASACSSPSRTSGASS